MIPHPRRGLASIVVTSAAILVLAGCALGPNYQRPPTPPLGQGPFVSIDKTAATTAEAPDDWWRLYDDAVLDRLIRQAFAANTDIRTAEANLTAARGVLDQAKAGFFPSTTLSGGAAYGRSADADASASSSAELHKALANAPGANLKPFGPTEARAGWSFDPEYDVSYEVDLFGRVRRTVEAARGDYQAQRAALDAVRITVAAETARAYADGCAYQEEVDAAERNLKILQDTYAVTLKQRDVGSASDYDVARTAALLEQAEAAVPPLEGQRRASLFELAALIGLTPAAVPADAAACKVAPKIAVLLPVGDGARMLRRRPDVREAERHLAAETARIGVAEADLFPTVNLVGSVSILGNSHHNLLSNNDVSWGIGPLINWSFPNILVARGEIIAAKGTAKAALASFDGTVLTALKEAEQALSTYNSELIRHAALVRGLNDSQRAYQLASLRYQAGSIAYLDLLTTEQTLINAQSSLASSDETLAADQINLFKALGGGWASAANTSPRGS
jgi:NodT family efflux transporter outer membrane factor (OMF) lipoprotein